MNISLTKQEIENDIEGLGEDIKNASIARTALSLGCKFNLKLPEIENPEEQYAMICRRITALEFYRRYLESLLATMNDEIARKEAP